MPSQAPAEVQLPVNPTVVTPWASYSLPRGPCAREGPAHAGRDGVRVYVSVCADVCLLQSLTQKQDRALSSPKRRRQLWGTQFES